VKRTWWVLPYFSGMLAVFAVAGLLSVTVLHHSAKPQALSTLPPTAQATLPMPAQMVTDTLFRTLTADLQAHDEAKLLGLVAPAAKPAVQAWWGNLNAIGYSTGVIIPTSSNSVVSLDNQGDGTITVLAGAHNTYDPVASQGKDPDIPCERYQLGLHFASATAIGQITSWHPLNDAPWDQATRLYVRTAPHLVVAGLPGDKALVNQILPKAEAAANFDGGLLSHVNSNDLHQDGFIVFVGNANWFSSGPQTAGWPQAYQDGRTVPLTGAIGDMTGITTGIASGTTGGARVLVTGGQSTAQLVRLFMLDILAPDDTGLAGGFAPPVLQQWTLQGIADAVQGLYAANPDPTPARYNFSALTAGLRALPASYRSGRLPSDKQLFSGTATSRKDWNAVAASVYAYIGSTYGMNQLFGSAALLYTGEPTPFGNVLASSKGGTYRFYASATMKDRWRAWLASQ
jgi:hypothetical protein